VQSSTTLSGVGYASVTSITHSRQCCNNLISWRLSKWPTVRLVTCCLCRVKVHLQSISQLASQRDLSTCISDISGWDRTVGTCNNAKRLTIVCRVEVTNTIVCVKWRCECQDRQLFALVLCWGAWQTGSTARIGILSLLDYVELWSINFVSQFRHSIYKLRRVCLRFLFCCVCATSRVLYFSCVRWILCITYVAFKFFYARRLRTLRELLQKLPPYVVAVVEFCVYLIRLLLW